ncbi:MAG: hypothetical protein WCW02_04245 [Candidatus Buchananbacteria bacterium]
MNPQDLFKNLGQVEPTEQLLASVLLTIKQKNINLAKRKLLFQGLLLAVSGLALFPVSGYLLNEIKQSGLSQYLSLLFSDWSVIRTYWQVFVFSLAETLPLVSLTATLAVVFIFFNALRQAVAEAKIIHLIN